CFHDPRRGWPDVRAFTPVFDGLCPAMTERLVLRIEPFELLHPLAGVYFRRVDVALAVDGDVVQRRELPGLSAGAAEMRERLLRDAIDDAYLAVHAVDHVDELLLLVGREHQVIDRAGA